MERRIEWDARVTAVALLTPLPVSKGARTRVSYRMFGAPMQIDIEMIVWEPPRRSAVRGTILGTPDRVAGSRHFDRNEDGSATWTTRLMLIGSGRLGRLRERITGLTTERLTVRSQQNLKRLIEAEHRPLAAVM